MPLPEVAAATRAGTAAEALQAHRERVLAEREGQWAGGSMGGKVDRQEGRPAGRVDQRDG
ncbi:hypothetical protein C5C26_17535 [Rathayibacter sp. AY2B1]|nr:hypothetical protein C5C26_17535 [Rathayibacter sp. AY2B1]